MVLTLHDLPLTSCKGTRSLKWKQLSITGSSDDTKLYNTSSSGKGTQQVTTPGNPPTMCMPQKLSSNIIRGAHYRIKASETPPESTTSLPCHTAAITPPTRCLPPLLFTMNPTPVSPHLNMFPTPHPFQSCSQSGLTSLSVDLTPCRSCTPPYPNLLLHPHCLPHLLSRFHH